MKKVLIQDSLYDWNEGFGLDPMAVLTLQPWIKKLARRYLPKAVTLNLELDDLVQAGNIGALNAAKTFRPERNATFLTWASFRISDEMRKLCKQPVTISLDAGHHLADDDSVSLSEQLADPADQSAKAEISIQLDQLMSKLSKDEQKLLIHYYGLGKSEKPKPLKVLGKEYGLSGQAICNRIKGALDKMRRQSGISKSKSCGHMRQSQKNS